MSLRCTAASLTTAAVIAAAPLAVGVLQPAHAAQPVPAAQSAVASTAAKQQQLRTLTFASTVRSVDSIIRTLPGGVTYGRNHLQGKTMWGKRHANVDFLAVVEYVRGTGPFYGVVTVTRSDGSSIVFSSNGMSLSANTPGTTDSSFRAQLTVIGGSGKFARATGTGEMTGYRKAALGGDVNLTFRLTVAR